MEFALQIKNLCKNYGQLKAVDNISFSIEKGKAYAFLGCNGAGKSTTINMIAGILPKDSGDIIIYGQDIDNGKSDVKRQLGLVFQNSVLDKKLTAKENLINKAVLYGLPKEQIMANINSLAKSLDFEDFINRPIEKLSGGQARRIDLARALVHNPAILILDEPTTGLDPQTRQLVWKFIRHLQQTTELTIILTTHYMEEASDMDHVIIIDRGQILVEGSPVTLKTQYAKDYVKLYKLADKQEVLLKLKQEGLDAVEIEDGVQFTTKNLSVVRDLVAKYPQMFNDFEVLKGKMDDVFLNVTGKNLEDNNG